jgi:hypothetical protein
VEGICGCATDICGISSMDHTVWCDCWQHQQIAIVAAKRRGLLGWSTALLAFLDELVWNRWHTMDRHHLLENMPATCVIVCEIVGVQVVFGQHQQTTLVTAKA